MTKYKLTNGQTSIDFPNLEAVAAFKSVNPDWADIEPVPYTEEPEAVAPVVPEQVTLWQLRTQLAIMGLEDTITGVINDMVDGPEKIAALRAWERANNIRRFSPTVSGIKAMLQLSDAQVDQIFIQADLIDA